MLFQPKILTEALLCPFLPDGIGRMAPSLRGLLPKAMMNDASGGGSVDGGGETTGGGSSGETVDGDMDVYTKITLKKLNELQGMIDQISDGVGLDDDVLHGCAIGAKAYAQLAIYRFKTAGNYTNEEAREKDIKTINDAINLVLGSFYSYGEVSGDKSDVEVYDIYQIHEHLSDAIKEYQSALKIVTKGESEDGLEEDSGSLVGGEGGSGDAEGEEDGSGEAEGLAESLNHLKEKLVICYEEFTMVVNELAAYVNPEDKENVLLHEVQSLLDETNQSVLSEVVDNLDVDINRLQGDLKKRELSLFLRGLALQRDALPKYVAKQHIIKQIVVSTLTDDIVSFERCEETSGEWEGLYYMSFDPSKQDELRVLLQKTGMTGISSNVRLNDELKALGFVKLTGYNPKGQPPTKGFKHKLFQPNTNKHTLMRYRQKEGSLSYQCNEDNCNGDCAMKPSFIFNSLEIRKFRKEKPESMWYQMFYRCCPEHIDNDEDVHNEGVTDEMKCRAERLIEERKEAGAEVEAIVKAQKEQRKKIIPHVTYEELFTHPDYLAFQKLWAQRDDLDKRPLEEIDNLVMQISGGISITVFAPGITSAYENRSIPQQYQRNINFGLNTLMKHLGISCYDCREVVPSRKETWSEDKKTLESHAVDPTFKDGRRFSAIHPDHQYVPPCGYVQPYNTVFENQNEAREQWIACKQKCNECHDQSFSPEQSSTHRNRDHKYTTQVYEVPVQSKAEYVKHVDVMDSDEFKDVCVLIEDNHWEYSGTIPLEDFEMLRVRFALETNGKEITDYFTVTKDEWDNRSNVNHGTMQSRVKTWMNELRLNHIKKGQKCCRDCGRDTQNKEPYKLGAFHCDHGKYHEVKKKNARESGQKQEVSQMMRKPWKIIDEELRERIEAIKCAMCHDHHTGE